MTAEQVRDVIFISIRSDLAEQQVAEFVEYQVRNVDPGIVADGFRLARAELQRLIEQQAAATAKFEHLERRRRQ